MRKWDPWKDVSELPGLTGNIITPVNEPKYTSTAVKMRRSGAMCYGLTNCKVVAGHITRHDSSVNSYEELTYIVNHDRLQIGDYSSEPVKANLWPGGVATADIPAAVYDGAAGNMYFSLVPTDT